MFKIAANTSTLQQIVTAPYVQFAAVDAEGDVFYANTQQILEEPAIGGSPIALVNSIFAAGLAVDASGSNLYYLSFISSTLYKLNLDSDVTTTLATGFGYGGYLAIDNSSNLYVDDYIDGRIVEVPDAGGPATTVQPITADFRCNRRRFHSFPPRSA